MVMKKILSYLMLLIFIFTCMNLTSCQNKAQQKPQMENKKVAVNVLFSDDKTDKMFKDLLNNRLQAQQIQVFYKKSKPVDQLSDVEELLKQEVKLLVVQFSDNNTADKIVSLAKKKKVMVVAMGLLPPNLPFDGFVGNDAMASGQQQAVYLTNSLGFSEFNNILIINESYYPGSTEMTQGNMEIINKMTNYKGVELKKNQEEDIASLLVKNPDLLKSKAIITHSEETTMKISNILKEKKLTNKVMHVGYGVSEDTLNELQQQQVNAVIDFNPQTAVVYLSKAIESIISTGKWEGENKISNGSYSIPAKILPSNIITKDNIFLLKERYEQGSNPQGSSDQGSKDQGPKDKGDSKSGSQKKNTKILIQTKDGQKMMFDVKGEIEKIEVQGQTGGGTQQDQQSQGQQSGGQQGSGGNQQQGTGM
jgi:ABC-type sugar transport system substrate-binding protein